MSSLLSAVELLQSRRAERRAADEEKEELDRAREDFARQLAGAARYYQAAGATAAHIFYFWGMLLGAVVIAAMTGAAAWLIDFLLERNGIIVPTETYALAIAAVSAGALGACVSVMWRMSSGDFRSDYEAGAEHLRMIGGFRPFIGAVFGLGLFFAIKAGLLSLLEENLNPYLITFVSFIGGFSERFAPDIFGRAAENVGSSNARGGGTEPSSVDLGDLPRPVPTEAAKPVSPSVPGSP